MCEHDISIKVENGMIITYCKKCGAILDTKPANNNQYTISCCQIEGDIPNNGGQILHG